ncbi:MAG: nucleotidyltransferase domain-containing protein [bacterium]
MFRYQVDSDLLKTVLRKKGYKNLFDFSKSIEFNRVTLNNYLKGKGPLAEPYYDLCRQLEVDPLSLLFPISLDNDFEYQEEILPVVKEVCNKYPDIAVVLLGSRAKGNSKKYSDWDLGITKGGEELTTREYFRIKDFIEDLVDDLPRMVDVVNLDKAPIWFLQEMDYTPKYLGGLKNAYDFFLGVLNGIKKKR